MTHKIISTENYLLIVDDSEIKIGDIVLEKYVDGTIGLEQIDTLNDIHSVLHKKIIAHLPLNGTSILDGVDLLPSLENDVEQLAEIEYPDGCDGTDRSATVYRRIFIDGYNKAKEKYKYTEEDIMKAIKMAQEVSWDESGYSGLEHEPNKIIQSLQQPKMPISFECNMETKIHSLISNGECIGFESIIKKRKNSQGLTQWVGKYIF